jgi:hypothetical protein
MKERLMFIYSRRVTRFLINERGLNPITEAIHPTTNRLFSLYERTDELQAAMDEYKAQQPRNN